MVENQEIRKPDEDLECALWHNSAPFELEDIRTLLAAIPGHNDEENWYWVVQLRDERFYLLSAWCDYTGWDCQSDVAFFEGETAIAAAEQAKDEWDRDIARQLVAQLKGEQPYGLEVRAPIKCVSER